MWMHFELMKIGKLVAAYLEVMLQKCKENGILVAAYFEVML
jgi:hypothetical protein